MNLTEKFIAALVHKRKFPIRECSLCDYVLGFVYYNDAVHFHQGCNCTNQFNYRELEEGELEMYLSDKTWREAIELFVEE